MDRINQHEAHYIAGIGARKEAYREGTERVPHEHKRSFDSGIEQKGTEFLNDLPAGAGHGARIAPTEARAIIAACVGELATAGCTNVQLSEEAGNPESITTAGTPSPMQYMCSRWPPTLTS